MKSSIFKSWTTSSKQKQKFHNFSNIHSKLKKKKKKLLWWKSYLFQDSDLGRGEQENNNNYHAKEDSEKLERLDQKYDNPTELNNSKKTFCSKIIPYFLLLLFFLKKEKPLKNLYLFSSFSPRSSWKKNKNSPPPTPFAVNQKII